MPVLLFYTFKLNTTSRPWRTSYKMVKAVFFRKVGDAWERSIVLCECARYLFDCLKREACFRSGFPKEN